MTLEAILAEVAALGIKRVEVTGGEPLYQPNSRLLLAALAEAGYETLLETNGSLSIAGLDPRVVRIVDFKCPSSGESAGNDFANVARLGGRDEVKFVLADRADYEYARGVIAKYRLTEICRVICQPAAGELAAAELARWILEDGLDVQLGLQLHKIIWPGADRGV
jgi:7-carboxy-7-deazaguanine synthase